MKKQLEQFTDGILFQFLMVGSLSFSHIHDVVAAHGQAGWKSWLYPLSVDLLTVAAFRKIRGGEGRGFTWLAFLLGLSASLAANVIDSWTATPVGRTLAVAIGVWPAVALLVCTLLAHDGATVAEAAAATAETVAPETGQRPATVAPATRATVSVTSPATPVRPAVTVASATTPKPATVAVRATVPKRAPKQTVPAVGAPERKTIHATVLKLMAQHGIESVTGPMVADALGTHRGSGHRYIKDVKERLADGRLTLAAPAPAMSSSLSSSPNVAPATA